MVSCENEKIRIDNPHEVTFITVHDLNGNCLLVNHKPESEFLDFPFSPKGDLIIVVNYRHRKTEIIKSLRSFVV